MFWIGLILTIVLWVLKIRAALVISILVTTVLALDRGRDRRSRATSTITPSFSTLGQFNLTEVFSVLPLLTAITVIYTIMLTDFFDTMGTVTGVAAEAGLANEDGSVPGIGRVLIVDSVAAAVGGARRRELQHDLHRVRGGRRRRRPDRPRVDRHRRPVPAGDLPVADRRDHPGRRHGAGPDPRRLPDVHPGQGHRRHQRRGRHPGAADDDPDAPHLRHHGRHRRRVHLVGADQARARQGRRDPPADVGRRDPVPRVLPAGLVPLDHAARARRPDPDSSATPRTGGPTAAGPSFGATIRSDVPEDQAGRRAARDLRPPAGLAIGVDRRLRAGRIEGRIGGPGGRRPLHGAPDVQGHGGLPVVARDLARRSKGSAAPRTPPPIASRPCTGPASRGARPAPRWPCSAS